MTSRSKPPRCRRCKGITVILDGRHMCRRCGFGAGKGAGGFTPGERDYLEQLAERRYGVAS